MIKSIRGLNIATKKFGELEDQAYKADTTSAKVPPEFDKYFGIAATAAARFYSEGEEQLRELEEKGIIHRSTIAGGSLSVTLECAETYFNTHVREFSRDSYEQLRRTCKSMADMCTYYRKMCAGYRKKSSQLKRTK